MAQQTIDLGSAPNDDTGDTLRAGGTKINANFTELYGLSGTPVVTILVSDPNGDALTTGDGKAYWPVPSTIDGMDLIAVAAAITTVSSSGAVSVQFHNETQAMDMLTTNCTIDQGEKHSKDATTPAAIDSYAIVSTGDQIRIDVDGAGTGAKGLMVEMQFGFLS